MKKALLTRAVNEIISNFMYDHLPINFTEKECRVIAKTLYKVTKAIRKRDMEGLNHDKN